MLHIKKSQSILQWFNALTTKGDVNSLEQFTDGSHFYEIVASLQPFLLQRNKESNLAVESVIFSETSIACNEEVITSVEEEASEGKIETSVSESMDVDPFVVKGSDHTDTQKKYDVIRKFIDDFYHVESSSLIDYGECQKGKELELAQVAVFLLSAVVQNLSSEDKVVYNTILLEQEVQANICECLALVFGKKGMGENQINKSELHKVLSRAASYKAGSPNLPETLMLMSRLSIYADEQTFHETLERKEQRQGKETKDERIKRLARKGETSKNKNPNVESLQAMVDHLRGSVERLEKEKSNLKEKLEYYESNFGSTSDDISVARDLNSIKEKGNGIGSATDDVSESSHSTKYDYEMVNLLYDRCMLLSIVKQLRRIKCIAPSMVKTLRENCAKIKDPLEFSARLRDLAMALQFSAVALQFPAEALRFPAEPSVTTQRSRNFSVGKSRLQKNRMLKLHSFRMKSNKKCYY